MPKVYVPLVIYKADLYLQSEKPVRRAATDGGKEQDGNRDKEGARSITFFLEEVSQVRDSRDKRERAQAISLWTYIPG